MAAARKTLCKFALDTFNFTDIGNEVWGDHTLEAYSMIGSTLTLNARNRSWTFLELKHFSMKLANLALVKAEDTMWFKCMKLYAIID